MATSRTTPKPPETKGQRPGQAHIDATAAKRQRGIAARDAAKKAGIDPATFATVDALIDWHNNQSATKPANTPPQPKPANTPPPPKPANTGGGTTSTPPPEKTKPLSAKENKANYSFLITNGVEKKKVDAMSPEERKTLRDQMLEDAKTGEGDAARAAQNDVLENPPEEAIKVKVKGGNAAQDAAADKVAPKQNRKGSKKSATEPAKAGPQKRPKAVEASSELGDMDDPDIDGEDGPKKEDGGGKGLSGFFGGAGRAKDWQTWSQDPTKGMPDQMGYFQTPGTLRAVHALTRRPFLGTGAAIAAYKLAQPIYRVISGQQPVGTREEASKIPQGADGYNYWDQYDAKSMSGESQPPVKRDRFNETPWWENQDDAISGEKYRINRTPKPIPADNNSTSTDIIRRLRGTA